MIITQTEFNEIFISILVSRLNMQPAKQTLHFSTANMLTRRILNSILMVLFLALSINNIPMDYGLSRMKGSAILSEVSPKTWTIQTK